MKGRTNGAEAGTLSDSRKSGGDGKTIPPYWLTGVPGGPTFTAR
jgi:hypothetical protein